MTEKLLEIPSNMSSVFNLVGQVKKLSEQIVNAKSVLFLGRGHLFPIALEGALKLKEISYIHAEGYASGEMKHGPIALVDDKVPVGKSEIDNITIKEVGKINKPDFKIKNHVEILEKNNLLDYNKALKLSGSRFSVLRSSLATLHRALVNFMIDINVTEFQYEECIVPELVKSDCLTGTGQLPKFDEDLFRKIQADLIGHNISDDDIRNKMKEFNEKAKSEFI